MLLKQWAEEIINKNTQNELAKQEEKKKEGGKKKEKIKKKRNVRYARESLNQRARVRQGYETRAEKATERKVDKS